VTNPIRVLLVDDDALVRAGLRMMLDGARDTVEVVGETADGSEVLAVLDRHHVDVMLLDLRMPKLDGLGVLDLLHSRPDPPAVIVLTTFDSDDHVLRALRRGASGFLGKESSPAEIITAIERVAAGEAMLSPAVTRRLIDTLSEDREAAHRHDAVIAQLDALSPRYRQIAEAIAQGKSNAAIAAELHLSVATVKGHVSTVLTKLGLDNRVQIALTVQDARRRRPG
jgi:DNA-binding NarL/FixJ family response regulator